MVLSRWWALLGLLAKRLLGRPGFWVALGLIPLVVLGATLADREESGAYTVAVAAQDPQDPMAQAAIESLRQEPGLVRFLWCDTPQQARELLTMGQCHGVWVFPENMARRLADYVQKGRGGPVQVWETGQETAAGLARERLIASFYSPLAYQVFCDFVTQELGPAEAQELTRAYREALPLKDLVVFEMESGREVTQAFSPIAALLPTLLGLAVLMGALSGGMSALQDTRRQSFGQLRVGVRLGIRFLSLALAALPVALAAWGALCLFTPQAQPLWSLACFLVFAISVSALVYLVSLLCQSPGSLAAFGLPLLLGSVLASPGVADGLWPALQKALPTYWLAFSLAVGDHLWVLALYGLVAVSLGTALGLWRKNV